MPRLSNGLGKRNPRRHQRSKDCSRNVDARKATACRLLVTNKKNLCIPEFSKCLAYLRRQFPRSFFPCSNRRAKVSTCRVSDYRLPLCSDSSCRRLRRRRRSFRSPQRRRRCDGTCASRRRATIRRNSGRSVRLMAGCPGRRDRPRRR